MKEARKVARQANPATTKGPPIAWDEAVKATTDDTAATDTVQPSLVPTDDSP